MRLTETKMDHWFCIYFATTSAVLSPFDQKYGIITENLCCVSTGLRGKDIRYIEQGESYTSKALSFTGRDYIPVFGEKMQAR